MAAAGATRERETAQGFALCALGGAENSARARQPHRALALLGGGIAAVFAVAASRTAAGPTAPTVLTLPAAAMSDGASLGLPDAASVPVDACATCARTCTRQYCEQPNYYSQGTRLLCETACLLGGAGVHARVHFAYTASPWLQQLMKPEL